MLICNLSLEVQAMFNIGESVTWIQQEEAQS